MKSSSLFHASFLLLASSVLSATPLVGIAAEPLPSVEIHLDALNALRHTKVETHRDASEALELAPKTLQEKHQALQKKPRKATSSDVKKSQNLKTQAEGKKNVKPAEAEKAAAPVAENPTPAARRHLPPPVKHAQPHTMAPTVSTVTPPAPAPASIPAPSHTESSVSTPPVAPNTPAFASPIAPHTALPVPTLDHVPATQGSALPDPLTPPMNPAHAALLEQTPIDNTPIPNTRAPFATPHSPPAAFSLPNPVALTPPASVSTPSHPAAELQSPLPNPVPILAPKPNAAATPVTPLPKQNTPTVAPAASSKAAPSAPDLPTQPMPASSNHPLFSSMSHAPTAQMPAEKTETPAQPATASTLPPLPSLPVEPSVPDAMPAVSSDTPSTLEALPKMEPEPKKAGFFSKLVGKSKEPTIERASPPAPDHVVPPKPLALEPISGMTTPTPAPEAAHPPIATQTPAQIPAQPASPSLSSPASHPDPTAQMVPPPVVPSPASAAPSSHATTPPITPAPSASDSSTDDTSDGVLTPDMLDQPKPPALPPLPNAGHSAAFSLIFNSDATTIDASQQAQIAKFAGSLSLKPGEKLRIVAHSSVGDAHESRSRRLALQRLIAIRKHLIATGLNPMQINVQALADAPPSNDAQPLDRITFQLVNGEARG